MEPIKMKKLWLKGGIIGAIVCVALSLFYTFILFPLAKNDIGRDGNPPAWTTYMPLLTGHLLGFAILDTNPVAGLMCKSTEPVCTNWINKDSIHGNPSPSLIPMMQEGQAGYCVDQVMVPTASCSASAEKIGSWVFLVLLTLIYFVIGAVIGNYIEKRNLRKTM